MRERLTPLSGQNAFLQGVAKISLFFNVYKAVRAWRCLQFVENDQRLWRKRIKAPSLHMNSTEQISLMVGALPHSTLTFQSRHGYNVSGKVVKLSEYDEVISAYKTCSSEFRYR